MEPEMISVIVLWLIGTISILCAAYIVPGIKIERLSSAVWAAAALGLLNLLLRPILVFLTFPITMVTLGLFLIVINALMIMLAGEIVKGFKVDSFWSALWASLVISVVGFIARMIFQVRHF
jgi:putative membrane protein